MEASLERAEPVTGGKFRLREAVRAEARATWRGRFWWLWLLAAVGIELWALLEPNPLFGDPLFRVLCVLAAWVPAWLCAHLFATRAKDNPEPLREWLPAEFLARAAGRLLPFFGVLLVWTATFTGRALLADLNSGGGSGFIPEAELFWSFWCAWSLVFVASGCSYAAITALLSATGRRSRRWAIVPFVLLVGLYLDSLLYTTMFGSGAFAGTRPSTPAQGFWWDVTHLQIAPNTWTGVWSAANLAVLIGHPPPLERQDGFGTLCWLAGAAFMLFTAAGAVLLWAIAARRYRRHPASRRTVEPAS